MFRDGGSCSGALSHSILLPHPFLSLTLVLDIKALTCGTTPIFYSQLKLGDTSKTNTPVYLEIVLKYAIKTMHKNTWHITPDKLSTEGKYLF